MSSGAPAASAPQSAMPCACRNWSSSAHVAANTGKWKLAPIALRTTLAFQRSTVPGMATSGVGAQGGGGAEDRAHVSGVLDGVEDDDPRAAGRCECVEGRARESPRWPARPAASRYRRRWRTRRRRLRAISAPAVRSVPSKAAPRGASGELRGNEDAAHRERRAQQFLDGPDALGDEQVLSLARAAALKVAS